MYRENRRGDRGQPCLTPFAGRTLALLSPSIRIYSSSWYRFTQGDLQPDCSADRPVTGPRQPTEYPCEKACSN
eukprot:936657-Pelagomonas_calceolata.AAC.1